MYLNPNINDELTNIFFNYERYPKYRDDAFGDEIAMKVFHNSEVLIFYIEPENQESHLDVYLEAIKALPKRFIYSSTSTSSLKFGSYMQYFLMGGANMEPDKVFIVYKQVPSTIKIEEIRGELSVENIQNFIYDFYQKNKQMFPEFAL